MLVTRSAVLRSPRKLSGLPDDILLSIMEISPLETVLELSKVCRRFNEIVTFLLYTKIDLVNQPGRAVLLFRCLIRSPRLAKYVRTYKCIIENRFCAIARAVASELGLTVAAMQEDALRGARNLESLEVEVGPNIKAEDSACMMDAFRVLVSAEGAKLRRLSLHFPSSAPRFSDKHEEQWERNWGLLLSQIIPAQPLLEELEIWGLVGRVRAEEFALTQFELHRLQTLASDCLPFVQAVLASAPPVKSLYIRGVPLSCVAEDILPRLAHPNEVAEFSWSGGEVSDPSLEIARLPALLPNIRRLGLGFQVLDGDDLEGFYQETLPKQLQGFSNLLELDLSKCQIQDGSIRAHAVVSVSGWAATANSARQARVAGGQRGPTVECYGLYCQSLTRISWLDGSKFYRLEASNWLAEPALPRAQHSLHKFQRRQDIELETGKHCLSSKLDGKISWYFDSLVQRVGGRIKWRG